MKPIPVVVYAVKSSPDEKDSVGDQQRQVVEQMPADRALVAEPFGESKASGYRTSRGPELEAAMRAASDAANEHGHAELWVFHSSRLARGSGRKAEARSLLEVFTQMRRAGVALRSATDDAYITDGAMIGMADKMAHKFSEDLSAHVKRGLRQKAEAGGPVGAIPLGYKVKKSIVENKTVTQRVIDPATAPTVERIFDLVESGMTPGDVGRVLNTEGVKTARGTNWVGKKIRRLVENSLYAGSKGYPAIIEAERFAGIQAGLARLDPAQVAKRSGGRKPVDGSYFLRGIAHCGECGSRLYTRRQAVGRVYVCAHRRQGTGLCSAPPIPAELIEARVLRHLDSFIGGVEEWIREQVKALDAGRLARSAAVQRDLSRLQELDRLRERHLGEYRRLVAEGATTAAIALEEVQRLDSERAYMRQQIADGEAVVSEFSGPPDVDAALDYYKGLVELVHGRVEQAQGSDDLNRALHEVLAGLWVSFDGDAMFAEFRLRVSGDHERALYLFNEDANQILQTRTQTKVNRCLAEGRARLRQLGPAV